MAFLAKLAELRSMTPLSPRITRAMAGLYGLDGAKNCEIKCEWLRVSGRRRCQGGSVRGRRLGCTCGGLGSLQPGRDPEPIAAPHSRPKLCIQANDAAAVPAATEFLGSVGRMK